MGSLAIPLVYGGESFRIKQIGQIETVKNSSKGSASVSIVKDVLSLQFSMPSLTEGPQ